MKRYINILMLLLLSVSTCWAEKYNAKRDSTHYLDGTKVYAEDALYQGMNLKLDLANPILEAATSMGKNLSFELAMNWRIKQRYYPTFEVGYAKADRSITHTVDTLGSYTSRHYGQGGFFRVGIDINGLKKHPERLDALLVGVRLGTSMQQFEMTGIAMNNYYDRLQTHDFPPAFRADCWGEVVAGCQVQIYGGLTMGWTARMKALFTKKAQPGQALPYYIPGFGYRTDTNWGINYYIGYKF